MPSRDQRYSRDPKLYDHVSDKAYESGMQAPSKIWNMKQNKSVEGKLITAKTVW